MKEKLEKILKAKILCLFYAGSIGYGLNDKNSDADVIVIVDKDMEFNHLPLEDGIECFVMGKDYFKRVQELSEDTSDFVTTYADVILSLRKKDPIYLDDSYKEELESFIFDDWEDKHIKYFKRFIGFYELHLDVGTNIKKYYHIYRVRAMLDNYLEKGSFSLDYSKEWKEKIIHYKKHYEALPYLNQEFKDILDSFKKYIEEREGK